MFLTTHYMDEAQALADRVAIISGGVIVAQGPPSTLASRDSAESIVRFRAPAGVHVPPAFGGVEIRTSEPTRVLHELTGWALDNGVELEGLEVTRPTLEDVYLELTKDVIQ